MKYGIWNSDPDFSDEELESLREDYPDELADATENELRTFTYELNDDYLDDERHNLDISVGDILILGDIGRWCGRVQGYKLLHTKSLADILQSYVDGMSDIEFYSDGYNIRATEHHHDGTNHYLFREVREGVNIENLLDAIYSGEKIPTARLNRYTKSLHPYAARVYGWPCRQKQTA